MKILNVKEDVPFYEKVTVVEVWYDLYFKCWTVTKFNKVGYQIGDSEFFHAKRDAVSFARVESNKLRVKYLVFNRN